MRYWLKLLFALFVLNSALTLQNRWPTFGVRWVPELSIELAALLLALALIVTGRGTVERRLRYVILSGYVVLTLGRYLDITAPALMGRSIHLYWDSQHLPQVAALFLDQVAVWQTLLGLLALLALFTMLVTMLRWALDTVIAALYRVSIRRTIGALSLTLVALYSLGRWLPGLPTSGGFALPVTAMLADQVNLALTATVLKDHNWITTQPPLPVSDLSRFGKNDVLIIFFESQGALVFDDVRFAAPLAGDFATLERSLEAAGWQMASARVESSTFGGSSWLAHSSLLSGLRIADQGNYYDLLSSKRPTLVSRFADAGYRTVALMPGLRYAWPEGQFYRFDRIFDAAHLDYHGPAYGGWIIPDQYSLYRAHRIEVEPAGRSPLFMVFPTINSHAPFAPLPPYQPDWGHFDVMTTDNSVMGENTVALNERLDGKALAAAYIRSIRYNLEVLEGYLLQHAPANALLLVIGDHQPPAIVGGRDLPWHVPVHLFSRNPALISAFQTVGFQPGITPGPTTLGGIEKLGPLLLQMLDRSSATPAAEVGTSQPNGIHQK